MSDAHSVSASLPAIAVDPGKVANIRSSIRIADTAQITAFGERAQRDVASFADKILSQTKNREMGDTGALLSDIITKAQGLDPASLSKQDFISRMFGGLRRAVSRFQQRFETVAAQIDRITVELEKRIDLMRRDVTMLDGLYDQTKDSIGNLDVYIAAGKAFADDFRRGELAQLETAAKANTGDASKDVMAAQQYQDAVQSLDRLEKRVLYLQQARQIAIQQMPQIRIVQSGDTTLIESLQASVTLTVPAWKQKMVLLLGLTRQQEALEMQKTVTDATNKMIRDASDMMKTQAIDIETQSQRGIVDIDTLEKTNQDLIDTIQGVLQIQSEGRRKRAEIEQQMDRQTAALKTALATAPQP
ncbi:MAG: toxic anion resistance protein [Alphaproteobacteria bacterium]|nr:toxic anion resistance protein [Alphaproteobacteria bacterium]MBL6936946.1 toxic anion resistance protein [Alphaproteobacteria bacterium]MBL7097715.1 toxic anion resistance protein [Alphaproteobacteria bacterium]